MVFSGVDDDIFRRTISADWLLLERQKRRRGKAAA
jgi:hypothetical protein